MQPDISLHAQGELLSTINKAMLRGDEILQIYEPLPYQEQFHACRSPVCVFTKGNQVGGSLAAFVELARAVTNQDPYDKYPKQGVAAVIGYGEKHIGRVIYNYLFEPGPNDLRMIKDLDTGKWRMFRPWEGEAEGKKGDIGREKQARQTQPLIPRRFIKGRIAFDDAAQRIFTRVDFVTGWTLYAFNSQGESRHAMGSQFNLVVIDEDIQKQDWYAEMVSRTMIPASHGNGFIRWNALPHGGNLVLYELVQEGDRQQESPNPHIARVHATIFDNPYLSPEVRERKIAEWRIAGEHEVDKRAYGRFSFGEKLMYPRFRRDTHCIPISSLPNAEVPADWCRYLIVDPGVQPANVLFCAMPPPDGAFGNIVLVYDELQVPDCNAALLAERVHPKAKGFTFHEFIMDQKGSDSRETGSGIAIARQYRDAFERKGLKCEVRGCNFKPGSKDVRGRVGEVANWVASNPTSKNYPALRVVNENCPKFIKEMQTYKHKLGPNEEILEEPNVRGIHLPVCLEYLAAYKPRYHKPEPAAAIDNRNAAQKSWDDYFEKKFANRKNRKSVVYLS